MTALLSREDATFSDLKALLGLTQGNLGVHLRKLEDAGYVGVTKEFVGRKPRTSCKLTRSGRKALLDHVAKLGRIVDEAG